jgi:hypothetical protein
MSDEWRVEAELEEEGHGATLVDRLSTLYVDQEARERLGGRAIVTTDAPRLFVYTTSEDEAREAERIVRGLAEEEELGARIAVTRWHPDAGEWKDASVPLPETPEERWAEYDAKEAAALRAAEESGEFPFEVRVDMPTAGSAIELARSLHDAGEPVHRRWRHVLVGVPTEERANELAGELRGRLPEGAEVEIEAHGVRYPVLMLIGSAT